MLPPGTVVLISSGPSEIVAETTLDESCVVYSDRISDDEVRVMSVESTSLLDELKVASSEKVIE